MFINTYTYQDYQEAEKIFYVCSYTGCGTKVLCRELQKYGIVHIIHDLNPPTRLTFAGLDMVQDQHKKYTSFSDRFHFNRIKYPDEFLSKTYVIYIYRNPIDAIYSKVKNALYHHIHLNGTRINFEDVINREKDFYKLNDFFHNYAYVPKRNYNIYCIKYEDMFDNQEQISKLFDIGPINMEKKERVHERISENILKKIYRPLIERMILTPPIRINGTNPNI